MVEIKGIEKFAPRDYPGHISATFFTGGCNFRCPFCHNSDLVLRPETLPDISREELEAFLDSRQDWLEAVCVSGGEPLLHRDIDSLLKIFKARKLLVKLDTNGSFPARIKALTEKKLVDFWAMDIKGPLEKYQEICGKKTNPDALLRSMDLIRNSGVAYMFRTTVVPGLLREHDLEDIGKILQENDTFQLQQFSPHNTLDPAFLEKKPYPLQRITKMAEGLKKYLLDIRVEGE